MHQQIRLKSVLAIGTVLSVSVAGKCTNFNFDVDAEPFGIGGTLHKPLPISRSPIPSNAHAELHL